MYELAAISLLWYSTSSAEVVAMVLAPLFTEKGHPAGLSLATSLSLLPPHTLPLSLPPPRTPAVSLLPLISAPPLQRPPQSDQAARRLKGMCVNCLIGHCVVSTYPNYLRCVWVSSCCGYQLYLGHWNSVGQR